MIGVEEILDILKITVWTGALEGERPISTALFAPVGDGKTTMLRKTDQRGEIKRFLVKKGTKDERWEEKREIKGSVLYTNSITPYRLYTRHGRELKSGQIKHVAIGDFLNILNLPKHIQTSVINFYNNAIEEGILSIESRDGQFIHEVPVTIGLITTIAKEDFDSRRIDLSAQGFLSRILPVSFDYTEETAQAIRDSVKRQDYLNELESFNITLPDPPVKINLALNFANMIEEVALRVKDKRDKVGARRLKQLQRFCMANALKDGRSEVGWEDITKLREYEKYFNTKCKAKI